MNRIQKDTHEHHHRVINSSTGADVEDEGMAIDTGIFVEFVDDDEVTGMVTAAVGSGK